MLAKSTWKAVGDTPSLAYGLAEDVNGTDNGQLVRAIFSVEAMLTISGHADVHSGRNSSE
jgi:hypothetical protein